MAISQEKKEKNVKETALLWSIIVGIILCYIMGSIGILAQETGSLNSGISEFFTCISENQFFFGFNSGIIGGLLFAILVAGMIYLFISNEFLRHLHYDPKAIAGTAHFLTEKEKKEYDEKYIEPDSDNIDEPSKSFIMSQNMRRPVNLRRNRLIGNNNVLVVGGAGTGKSRFVIKPNALQMNCSFVITDPSGEMIYSLGDVLKNHGYKIKIFNIEDMQHSNCYNPLEYIRNESGVMMLIECLIKNTSEPNAKAEDFWPKAERLLYSACIFYLRDFCTDESKKNFITVLKMINMSAVDENNAGFESQLDRLFKNLPQDSLAAQYYKSFKQAAGKTLKSIIISCVTRIQAFMIPQVINLTKTDEMELDKIGYEKTALFIITPQADRTYSFLASMLYSQLFETLYYQGEQQKLKTGDESLPIPVRCLMDEFANIGEIPEFPSKLSTMRKYNISATVILQDISQIEAMYKDQWKTIVSNCSSIIFLGSTEPNTLKYFSDKLGKGTVTSKSRGLSTGKNKSSNQNYQQTGRELKFADELEVMPDDECIVFTQNHPPFQDKKFKYEDHIRYSLTADADPAKAFVYNTMPAYDNARLRTSNILRAKSEASRIKNANIATKPKPLVQLKLDCTKKEAADSFEINERLNKAALDKAAQECMDQIVKEINDKGYKYHFYSIKLKDIPPKELEKIALRLLRSYGQKRFVIFSESLSDNRKLYGCWCDANRDMNTFIACTQSDFTKDYNIKTQSGCAIVTFNIARNIIKNDEIERYCNTVEREYLKKKSNEGVSQKYTPTVKKNTTTNSSESKKNVSTEDERKTIAEIDYEEHDYDELDGLD